MLKDEKGQYERIMQELTQKFSQMDQQDQTGLVNKMKEEAVEPTQDAIKVLACLRLLHLCRPEAPVCDAEDKVLLCTTCCK